MLFLGLGIGQCMQPLTIIVQNAVPPREIGVATSSATFFRQLGGTIGVAVFLSLLFSTLGGKLKDAFTAAGPGIQRAAASGKIPHTALNDQVLSGLKGKASGGVFTAVQDDSSIIGKMAPVLAHPFKVGFADSMSLVLLSGGSVMIVAFLILLLMPKVELRTTSASAAARAEQNAAEAAPTQPAAPAVRDTSGTGGGAHRASGPVVTATDPEDGAAKHVGTTDRDTAGDE
jgi:hypothetical protein